MNLEESVANCIVQECDKLISRHHKYHNALHLSYERNVKRVVNAPKKWIKTPKYWKIELFNPFYVKSRAKSIAKSVARKIRSGEYSPHNPYYTTVPKHGGGKRKICVYEIPDAAVSNLLFRSLMKKNQHRFSSFSYAYREDRNVHYAIQDIAVSLRNQDRLFIAEFDFSDFFGSIEHEYLYAQFDANGFLMSNFEVETIRQFLSGRSGKGIPQGTSLSLFLANMACWKMDRKFEDYGLRFARYADDTVVWAKQYDNICKAYDVISDFSRDTGVGINLQKSDGISLLTKPGAASEFYKVKNKFDYLGYSISVDRVSIRDSSVQKIKKHISYLLYRHLIQPVNSSQLRALTVPNNDEDRDLVVAIQLIRRYLYGNLTEKLLDDYINGRISRLKFKGLMSFYPLVTDEDQLRELDGWLAHSIYHSLRKREKLFAGHGIINMSNKFPFNVTKDELINSFADQSYQAKTSMYRVPSFLRIYRAIRKGLITTGLGFRDNYNY